MVNDLDPVAQRLAVANSTHGSLVLDWLASRQNRQAMHRRAKWCTLGAWLLVTSAAVVGCIVAVRFAWDVRATFAGTSILQQDFYHELESVTIPFTVRVAPPLLAAIAVLLLIGGIIAWSFDRFPGLNWTRSAIDWSEVSDGVSRLLSIGCTYPEAFQTVAKVARTTANRRWLQQTADRIESGSAGIPPSDSASTDTAVLEMLVEENEAEPSERWRIAHQHFDDVACHRLALLQGTVPIISTLSAGLLIWISISATLGWMWATIARILSGGIS